MGNKVKYNLKNVHAAKLKINEVKLIGNRSLEELGLNSITNIELEELLK